MEPGLYYTTEINAMVVNADRLAKIATKGKTLAYVAFERAMQTKFPGVVQKYGWKVNTPGIEIEITPSQLPVEHKARQAHDLSEKASELAKEQCAKRCSLAELAETQAVNGFKARIRAVYGKEKPTEKELAAALTEWLRLKAPHTCPA